MENYELMEQNDIRLDCIIEMLFSEYVLKFSLNEESPNLYSNAKDLLLDVLNIKAYLGLVKNKYITDIPKEEEDKENEEADEEEETEAFVDSDFYKEIMKNLPNIENLYLTLTKGELSANYCMSHFSEAKFKLEEQISGYELSNEIRILRVLTKGIQQMVMMAVEQSTNMEQNKKTMMNDVINKSLKIFHHFEKIEKFSEEHMRKVETYEGKLIRGLQNGNQKQSQSGEYGIQSTGGGEI
jgi:2,3-bisphosphoglycerate-independent phosphoglycerate mutase